MSITRKRSSPGGPVTQWSQPSYVRANTTDYIEIRGRDVHLGARVDSGPGGYEDITSLRDFLAGDLNSDVTLVFNDVVLSEVLNACRDILEGRSSSSSASQNEAPAPITSSGDFGVFLDGVGPKKIQIIKITRELTREGLKAAKDRVESAPVELATGLDRATAEHAVEELNAYGASARLIGADSAPAALPSPSSSSSSGNGMTLRLESYGAKKIAVIKAVRNFTGLGLKETKALVESAPVDIATFNDAGRARESHAQLISAGASATLLGDAPVAPPQPVYSGATCDVILEDFGAKKIQAIKVTRTLTGLGLKEAKELVERAPTTMLSGVPREEAESAVGQLEEVGASARITGGDGATVSRPSPTPSDPYAIVTLHLDAVGNKKIQVIKVIRQITSQGLREAKYIADTAPSIVVQGVSRAEAESFAERLEEVGAQTRIA